MSLFCVQKGKHNCQENEHYDYESYKAHKKLFSFRESFGVFFLLRLCGYQ